MRVAILGGTYFIGPAIVEELLDAGHQVTTINRGQSAGPELPDAPTRTCDRRDGKRLRAVLDGTASDPVPLDEDSPVRERRYPYRGRPIPDLPGLDPEVYDKLDVEETYAAARATILRLPVVYGERDPKRREDMILSRALAGEKQIRIGVGNLLFTRGWVRDVARRAPGRRAR